MTENPQPMADLADKRECPVVQEEALKDSEHLPSPYQIIEDLGIQDWQQLEKKIIRRLDMTLLPSLWVLYVFNYLDRASLGQARLSTLDRDLQLTGYQFGNAISILSAGYVLGQLPSNMIIGLVRPSLYLPGCALIWSGVAAAVAGVRNYEGLLAIRFFLGIAEAPLFPGALYVMSTWYTRREIAVRVALLATGVPLANGMSGLIAAAVFSTLEGRQGVAGWQWLFIVLASCGGLFAIVAMFLLPDYPHSKSGSATWSMTEDMRKIAAARIVADRVSVPEAKSGIWYGLKLALVDYKLYLMILTNIFISAAYGFSNFYPAIVRGFGQSRTITLVMTFPPYVLAAIASVGLAWSSDRISERSVHFSVPIGIGMAAYVVCMISVNNTARYAASFFFIGGLFAANPVQHTWITGTFGRTPEKRAASLALNTILGQIGNVIAPYFFVDSDEPRYRLAFIMMFLMAGLCIATAMLLKFLLNRENKKLRQTAIRDGTAYQPYVT